MPSLGLGRDPERTPMQWDGPSTPASPTGTPWLPLPADAAQRSVEAERDDPQSMLTLYRRLLELRRTRAGALGRYLRARSRPAATLLAYLREHDGRRLGVVLNLGSAPAGWVVPDEATGGRPFLTASGRPFERSLDGQVEIPADEAIVFELV